MNARAVILAYLEHHSGTRREISNALGLNHKSVESLTARLAREGHPLADRVLLTTRWGAARRLKPTAAARARERRLQGLPDIPFGHDPEFRRPCGVPVSSVFQLSEAQGSR